MANRKGYNLTINHMKKNILAVLAVAIIGAFAFVGCGDSAPPVPEEKAVLFWEGDACPITGKKYDSADENDPMQGNVPLQFEHEGKNYEANVWDDNAVDEFDKNKDKYLQKIVSGSK